MRHWLIIVWITLLFHACDIINPAETIPSYIQIDSIIFSPNNPIEGSSNQKITEAWVTIDGIFIGVYDLPATIPILASGTVEVKIEAGIKDNGISTLPEVYPFFKPYITNIEIEPEGITPIIPTTSYKEGLTFAFVEDFESGSLLFTDDLDGDPTTTITPSETDVFEGNRSGIIRLNKEHPIVEIASDFSKKLRNLQSKGVYVYLELNYKTDMEVAFGLIGHETEVFTPAEKLYEPILFPKAEWNKVYLNLSEAAFNLKTPEYQVAIYSAIPAQLEQGNIWLDNIKLIHF